MDPHKLGVLSIDPVSNGSNGFGLIADAKQVRPFAAVALAGRHDAATQWTQDQAEHSLEKLSPREEQVLKMVGDGYSSAQIGLKLGIAGQTVNTHIKNIFRKLKVRTRAQAIFTAYECGLH